MGAYIRQTSRALESMGRKLGELREAIKARAGAADPLAPARTAHERRTLT